MIWHFDAVNFVERFDTRLDQLGLGRFVAKPFDEPFLLGNDPVLLSFGCADSDKPLFALRNKRREAALFRCNRARPDLVGSGGTCS